MDYLREYKIQSVLGLMQTVLILYAVLATATLMKAMGYPDDDIMVQWKSMALLVRKAGLMLMLLPIAWTCITIQLENGSSRFSKSWTLASGLFLLVVLYLVLWPIATEPGFRMRATHS